MNEGINRGLKLGKKYGETWDERQISMLQGIEKKLEEIRDFARMAEGLMSGEMEKEVAEKSIAEYRRRIESGVSQELLDKYQQLKEISDKIDKIYEEIRETDNPLRDEDYLDLSKVNDDLPEFEEKQEQINRLQEQYFSILESNKGLDFLSVMEFALNFVQSALDKIETYQKDFDLALKDLARAYYIDFERLKTNLEIERIVFTPISVSLVLKKGASFGSLYSDEMYDKNEDPLGQHMPGCLVNIISGNQDDEGVEVTIKHENEHVLEDALQTKLQSFGPPLSIFSSVINPRLPKEYRDHCRQELLENQRYSASHLLDFSHHEILAALTESQKLIEYLKSIQTINLPSSQTPEEKSVRDVLNKPKPISHKEKTQILYLLSTAGTEISKVIAVLSKGENTKDPEMKKLFKERRLRYVSIFLRSMGNLGLGYSLADKLGEEARKDVRLLTYLLKPSQYHHIPMLLRYKHA